jgi:hypothetical protein
MELRETTREVLAQVEQITGFPAVVVSEADMPVLSTASMASSVRPGHVIRYHPSVAEQVDYFVTFQCGFILRHYDCAPEDRRQCGPTESGLYSVEKLLRNSPAKSLSSADLLRFRDQLLKSLVTHLRSVPIGMRVDRWIAQDHSVLAEAQRTAIERQLQQNMSLFDSPARKSIPPKIVADSMAISSAFAEFWAERWNEPELLVPYTTSGYAMKGRELLEIWKAMPDSGKDDYALIDAWGVSLGIEKWYHWVP